MELVDTHEITLEPLLYRKPAFDLPLGIFSSLERCALEKTKKITICYNRAITPKGKNFFAAYIAYKKDFLALNPGMLPLNLSSLEITLQENCGVTPEPMTPAEILQRFPEEITHDLRFLNRDDFLKDFHFSWKGNPRDIYIHPSAEVDPPVFINAEDGPVVLDAGVKVSAFSYLKGPLYIGQKSHMDHVTLESSRIGMQNRLGGEVADSWFGNFSNKHHEGFVGHSIVGDWVNLGALTTTSDLKNNYGKIRLEYNGKKLDTGEIKFGSIIGDFVKTSIGTMLNTGTIISPGSLIMGGSSERKYYPPFFWGAVSGGTYRLDKFLADTEKIMARRDQSLHPLERLAIESIHPEGGKKI